MTRFIHLTDLHVSHPDAGDPNDRGTSRDALRRVVALINEMQPLPDFVVASGDLTNMGDPLSYGLLKDLLEPLKPPLILAMGNHDRVPSFAKSLAERAAAPPSSRTRCRAVCM